MNLFALRERLAEAGAQITFSGSFSHSVIEELATAVKVYLERAAVQKSSIADVFSVYIEAAQNVRNYTAARLASGADPQEALSSILVIAKRGERYEVHTGNVVAPGDATALAAHLDDLATLDQAALKARYKKQLRRGLPPGAMTAGLGLIDMARRASRPLSYELTPMPDGRYYFSLRVVI